MTHAFGPLKSSDQRTGSEFWVLLSTVIFSAVIRSYRFIQKFFIRRRPIWRWKAWVIRLASGLVAWMGERDDLSQRRARTRPAWSRPPEQSVAHPRIAPRLFKPSQPRRYRVSQVGEKAARVRTGRINRASCARRSRGDLAPNSRRPVRYPQASAPQARAQPARTAEGLHGLRRSVAARQSAHAWGRVHA
jgi:hypothetical protein